MCRTLVNAMHIDIIIVHLSSSVDLQLYRFCTYTMCYLLPGITLPAARARYRLLSVRINCNIVCKNTRAGRCALHVLCDV